MTRFFLAWRLVASLGFLSVGKSIDSFNLDLEVLDEIDLSALGTPNLDRYKLIYNLTVDDQCQYQLKVDFFKHENDEPGDSNFTGVCDPSDTSGVAPDGKKWHEPRRNWLGFPQYVFATTGFDHMSLYWQPCGREPLGLKQPRYELNFYTVIPQYRAFMICQEHETPEICQVNQTSFLGRGHFTVPRVERSTDRFVNMPFKYAPDPLDPQAHQYEGLSHWDLTDIPETPEEWILPQMEMSTYDGDVTTLRTLLPAEFITGSNSSEYYQTHTFVYQTLPRLPGGWNMTYNGNTEEVSVILFGEAGLCGSTFETLKAEQEEEATTRSLRGQ